ncbi:tyrosine-type recombinase/integrase [Microseira sp. BLCC-F43]|jgi:integrase|uniref:tyrosine-type recombinase/integrase n=1 Tax=Microseira sp. BLCC-F43 TaxID=3153602 RepID=UPI0035B90A68
MARTPKGGVTVEEFKGRLRLYWSWEGKRFFLYVGLPDTQANRKAARIKADKNELDIVSGNFDPSLAKYKPERQQAIALLSLWDKFVDYKQRQVQSATLEKYRGLRGHLESYFKSKSAQAVTETVGLNFRDWLLEKLEPITVRERLVMLSACWQWGIKKKLVQENPWAEIKVSVSPKQKPNPFTLEEINNIINKFRTAPRLLHYADYVEFKFGVGLRTGESAALQWKHCSKNCSSIWIGESISRGNRKATKNNKARTIFLTPRLQQLLQNRKNANNATADVIIFTSMEGNLIDSKNFCRRYWKPALEELGIDYRRPYTTRHTLISHGLETGMNAVAIASLTGHDVRTLYESYAGLVNQPQLPDLLPPFSPASSVDSLLEIPDISE